MNRQASPYPFSRELRSVGAAALLLRLFPVPVGLVTARALSRIVAGATAGRVADVAASAGMLLAVVTAAKLVEIPAATAQRRADSQARHRCRLLLYGRFLASPLSAFARAGQGESLENLNDDFTAAADRSLKTVPCFLAGLVTAAAYAAFLCAQSAPLAACLTALALVQLVPPLLVRRVMQTNYDQCRDIEAEITDRIVEGYEGMETIKLYGLKPWFLVRMAAVHRRYLRIGNRSEATATAEHSMNKLVDSLLTYGAYALAGLFALFSLCSMDTAVEAIALSGGLFAAVKAVFAAVPQLAVARTVAGRLRRWDDGGPARDLRPADGTVRLSGLRFSYDGKSILDGADAVFEAGHITLLRGQNGVGKSTLFGLATGLLRPDGGSVTVGGADPARLADAAFPRGVFCLAQRDPAFDFSARELFSALSPDDAGRAARMERVAAEFGLTDRQLDGLKIRELSGGERKKVFLSAAFALDPPVLLLDEPTNSLDAEGKEVLCRLLKERRGGAVLISHEDVFDALADRVYVLENGGMTVAAR